MFTSCDTGYVINNSELYKTVDFGENWEKIYSSDLLNEQTVYFSSPQIGYLTDLKLITKDGGNTWSGDNSKLYGENLVLINQKESYYIENGSIRRKIVGEREPYYMTKEIDKSVFKLFFPSDRVGYAIGVESVILKYTVP